MGINFIIKTNKPCDEIADYREDSQLKSSKHEQSYRVDTTYFSPTGAQITPPITTCVWLAA